MSASNTYTVTCEWDAEAGVWYVAESDVPGLVTEAESLDALAAKLRVMVPEMLELNCGLPAEVAEVSPFVVSARIQNAA